MMRESFHRLALVALALCLMAGAVASPASAGGPCASTVSTDPDSGVGGTGLIDPDDGIGGTGLIDPDDGIGGTGVLGTVTGFASLCVNGLEIHYAASVPVLVDGVGASSADLAIGQVVWVIAEQEEEKMVARAIEVLSALVGPIEALDLDVGSLRVAGEEVDLLLGVRLLEDQGGKDAMRVGDRVAVSGLRRSDGRLLATRVEPAADRADGARELTLAALLERAPRVERVVAQGYAEPVAEGTRLAGLDFRIEGPRPARDERIRAAGRVFDGAVRAARWQPDRPIRPERPEPLAPPSVIPMDRPPTSDLPGPPDKPLPPPRPEPVPAPLPPERPEIIERPDRPERVTPPERIERPDVVRPGT